MEWWKTDIVIEHKWKVYIIEAKIGNNHKEAMEQINRQYEKSFKGRDWYKIGITYDKNNKTWKKIFTEIEKL